MEGNLNFFQMEVDLNFWEIADNIENKEGMSTNHQDNLELILVLTQDMGFRTCFQYCMFFIVCLWDQTMAVHVGPAWQDLGGKKSAQYSTGN